MVTSKETNQNNEKNTSKKMVQKQWKSNLWKPVLVIGSMLVLMVGSVACSGKDNQENPITPTLSQGVTQSLTIIPTEKLEKEEITPQLTSGEKPTSSLSVTEQPEVTQSPKTVVTAEQALSLIQNEVDERIYTISLLNDYFMLDDGKLYHMFCISDETGDLEPLLLVEQESGIIKCYSLDGVLSDFSHFPLDNVEQNKPSSEEISKEEALKFLEEKGKEALGLTKNLSDYDEITYDDWTTTVNGISCYSINVLEQSNGKLRLRGTYYVAVDGSQVYRLNSETNEFILVE